MLMEVRCCCVPRKLLGWMSVPEKAKAIRLATADANKTIELPIADLQDGKHTIKAVKAEGMTFEELLKYPSFIPNSEYY